MSSRRSRSSINYRRTAGGALTGIVTSVMLTTHFGSVQADNSPKERDFTNRFYVGIGAGITDLDPESRTPALTVGDHRDTGFTLFLGYDFSRYLTVEGYYANLGEAGIDFLGDPVGTIDYQVFGVSAIGYLFNTRGGEGYQNGYDDEGRFRREGLSGYLRLGLGAMSNDSTTVRYERDYTSHLSAGLGLEYGWSNGFAVRGELSSFDTDAHYLGVSILKRFGSVPAFVPPVTETPVTAIAPPESKNPEPLPVDLPSSKFAFGKYALSTRTITELNRVVNIAQADASLQFKVEGHTDAIGSESYNQSLSIRRAEAVRQYLLFEGISESRIMIQGFGETQPIAPNDTDEGRALNRRVDIDLR